MSPPTTQDPRDHHGLIVRDTVRRLEVIRKLGLPYGPREADRRRRAACGIRGRECARRSAGRRQDSRPMTRLTEGLLRNPGSAVRPSRKAVRAIFAQPRPWHARARAADRCGTSRRAPPSYTIGPRTRSRSTRLRGYGSKGLFRVTEIRVLVRSFTFRESAPAFLRRSRILLQRI